MQEQFVDYEHSKMLKELGMVLSLGETFATWGEPESGGGLYMGSFDTTAIRAYLFQQAEQWLWEKKKIWVNVWRPYAGEDQINDKYVYSCVDCNDLQKGGNSVCCGVLDEVDFNSPITAKNEAIKKAIEYLHKQLK